MNWRMVALTSLITMASIDAALAQQPICVVGGCDDSQTSRIVGNIILDPLREQILVEDHQLDEPREAQAADRLEQVIRATVRVTVSGVCGSGTVIGRDSAGDAIVLTNAHVAGTTRGRTVNLERWNTDGSSEQGTGSIIAAGYGKGMSIDFALLRCNEGFARDVTPIPLANRYPDKEAGVTTFGCPRCEWPSLQVLQLNRSEGQILSWKPVAIGGRSGSSLIDYTASGPRVVGLLTWAGGDEGFGQSTPFLLSAMRGKLPATLVGLPPGVREVAGKQDADPIAEAEVYQVPATTSGQVARIPVSLFANSQVDDDLLDNIVEPEPGEPEPHKPEPPKPEPGDPEPKPTPISPDHLPWSTGATIAASAATGFLLLLGLQYGIPLLLQVVRQNRKGRGKPVLTDDQFDQLIAQYKRLVQLLEQNTHTPESQRDLKT